VKLRETSSPYLPLSTPLLLLPLLPLPLLPLLLLLPLLPPDITRPGRAEYLTRLSAGA